MSTPNCTCDAGQNAYCSLHGRFADRPEADIAAERKKLAEPLPGFSADKQNHAGGRRHSDDRGDMVDPELRAAFDHGFRVGIETAMKLYGGK